MIKMEIWKDIDGFVGKYQVSSYGRVRRLGKKVKEIYLAGDTTKGGYAGITLRQITDSGPGKVKRFFIHRLVAAAFIPNPESKRCINHIDGNKKNNLVSNLEWCTYTENMDHAYELGLRTAPFTAFSGESHATTKFTKEQCEEMMALRKDGCTLQFIANKFGAGLSTVSRICKGEHWSSSVSQVKFEKSRQKINNE